ncbi:MAG TPA: hypothetical protein VLJ59_07850 [Mycobacteriales bacterium]|nr:hypothetical protein [Mycobacteriales bacterium]
MPRFRNGSQRDRYAVGVGSGQRCVLSGWSYQTYCSVVVAVMPNRS